MAQKNHVFMQIVKLCYTMLQYRTEPFFHIHKSPERSPEAHPHQAQRNTNDAKLATPHAEHGLALQDGLALLF